MVLRIRLYTDGGVTWQAACGATSMPIPGSSSLLTPTERKKSIVHCRNSGQAGRPYDLLPTRGPSRNTTMHITPRNKLRIVDILD
jgi:hypothetical protein